MRTIDIKRTLTRLGIEFEEQGDNLVARCPYHEDSKPSWRMRKRGEKAGLHHCFSCGAGGDLPDLVKHLKGYGTKEGARGWIAKQAEELTRDDLQMSPVVLKVQATTRRAFRMPVGVEPAQPLDEWPTPVRVYAERRGITPEQVARWSIRYALEGRLQGRVVIPVYTRGWDLRGYMARAFTDAAKRYLYPREEEGPDLDTMFGELHWPERGEDGIRDCTVVVTEGALKSLAVERARPELAQAALGGSGLRPLHVAKLATFKLVVVLTDNDEPGVCAGDDMEAALSRHTKTVRVTLPVGKDPDSVPLQELRDALARRV